MGTANLGSYLQVPGHTFNPCWTSFEHNQTIHTIIYTTSCWLSFITSWAELLLESDKEQDKADKHTHSLPYGNRLVSTMSPGL